MIKHALLFCFGLLLSMQVFTQQIEGIKVIDVASQEDDRVYYMDATIETHLPEYVLKAFYNGIPLPLVIQVEVNKARSWWFDQALVTVEQRYLLHYYPLYDSVQTDNLNDGSVSNYSSLTYALKRLGTINHYPLLDKEHFGEIDNITARIRLKIDSSRLPKPLRATSLLGGNWDISSEWKEWTLR